MKTVGAGSRPGAETGGDDLFSRRVVAVLLADVAGYSTMMGEDDERTTRALGELHAFIGEIVGEMRGRSEPKAGDSILATFESVAAAVDAAIAIQTRIEQRTFAEMPMLLRIGVHFGDVLQTGGGWHGDAINVASRLQQLARPGAICVSEGVYRQIRSRITVAVVDLGRQRLKNISDPLRAYLIVPGEEKHAPPRRRLAWSAAAVVAVLAGALLWWQRERIAELSTAAAPVAPPAEVAAEAGDVVAAPVVTLGVMIFKQLGDGAEDHAWMREAIRDGLNTQLSALSRVKVYSKEFLDFLVTRQGLSEIEVAEKLGITKMLTGSFLAIGDKLKVDTHVVDVPSGVIEASYTATGQQERFLDLQNEVVMGVVSRLDLEVTDSEREALVARRATDAEALRLLLEAEGASRPHRKPPPKPTEEPDATSRLLEILQWPSAARGAEVPSDEAAIRDLLERYRAAMESGSAEALRPLYRGLSDEQLAAQERYFENVRDLEVGIDEIDLAVVGDEAVVSYTRKDRFVDRRTGRTMDIAVRLTKTLVRDGDAWKLKPGE